MLPPQAPPAHIADARASAIASIQRMADAQRWIVKQQGLLPALPADLQGRDTFLADLDAWWQAEAEYEPGRLSLPRDKAFRLQLAQAMRDDATLRGHDGSLSADAVKLARTVAEGTGGAPPGHVHARELMFGERPYAGALVLQDDWYPGFVLLFTVEEGWSSFPSLDALHRDVERRMRILLADREGLPGIGLNDLHEALDTHFLDSRPIDGNVFATLGRRLVERVRERVLAAYRLAADGDELRERLRAALNLHALLDTYSIMRHRDVALAARIEEEKLAHAPDKARKQWREAASAYRDGWRLARRGDLAPPPSLAAFALEQLAEELTRRGIAVPPGEIHVRVTRKVPEKPLANLISGFPSEDLPLLEFAYRNVTDSSTEALTVIHPDGKPRDDVPAEALRGIVRDLDLPNRYARRLDELFGDTDEGRTRRASVAALQLAALRFEAEDARIASYHAFADPAAAFASPQALPFIYDRLERGYAWVKAVLDHPAAQGRARVEGHELVVHQFTYKGATLAGVFMVSARQRGAVGSVVLHTPDAPDGIAFREFHDRDELERRFFLDRTFESYLIDRLPEEFSEVGPTGERRFKVTRLNGDRTIDWVLGTDTCDDCTVLAERFGERELTTSFIDAAYDGAVELAKRNARHRARDTGAATHQGRYDIYQWTNVPSLLLREVIVGAVQAVPRTAQAAWRFYDHVKAGETVPAFLDFVEGYTSALEVLPLYTHVPRLAGGSARAAAGSRKLMPTRRALPEPATLFEERYLAQGITPPPGEVPRSGVYTIGGKPYISQGGRMYHVAYDPDVLGWRLSTPGSAPSLKTGGAIERLPGGGWRYRQTGLLGGGDLPSMEQFTQLAHTVADPANLNPVLQPLTQFQRSAVAARVSELLPFDAALMVMRRMAGREQGPLRPSHLQVWNEAVEYARRAPATAPSTSFPWSAPSMAAEVPQPTRPGGSGASAGSGSSGSSGSSGAPAAGTGAGTVPRSGWYRYTSGYPVPRRRWPNEVYAYVPPQELQFTAGSGSVSLNQLRVVGLSRGVPVSTLPPSTPLDQVPSRLLALLPRQAGPQAARTLGEASGSWVRVNLRNLHITVPGTRNLHQYRLAADPWGGGLYYLNPVERGLLPGGRLAEGPVRLFGNEFDVGYAAP